jgi:uncharacterized protein involved in propanediol utilization
VKVGTGTAHAHHGEILQGAFHVGEIVVRCLVTLPYTECRAVARFQRTADPQITVSPPTKLKAARAAALTLRHQRVHGGGHLELSELILEQRGLGSSTADCVAAVRAVADELGIELAPETIAELVVEAELAADAIMFDRPVLFAHREGRVVEYFPNRLPALAIVGVNAGPGIDTLALPRARYTPFELRRFDELRRDLRAALHRGDAAGVASVATASARINQTHLPFPGYEQLEAIADATNALGVQVAHSGSVAGLIFDPRSPSISDQLARAREALALAGFAVAPAFYTAVPNPRSEAA